jgi:hypothetical protein
MLNLNIRQTTQQEQTMDLSDYRNMPGPNDPECWPACTGHPMDPRTPDEYSPDYAALAEDLMKTCADITVAGKLAWEWEVIGTRIADILQALALHNDGTAANDQAVGRLVRSLVMEELESVCERMFEREIDGEAF